MASIKLSELQSIAEVNETDLLYIADTDTQTSRKTTVSQVFQANTVQDLGDYDANQEMNLQEGLSTGYMYVQNLTIGD